MTNENNTNGTDNTKGNSVPYPAPGIGTRISAAAKDIGTRKDAANVGGVSDDMLYRYMREETDPPFGVVARICRESGRSLDWMAEGSDITQCGIKEDSAPYEQHDKLLDYVYQAVYELESVLKNSGLVIDKPENKAKLVAMCVDYLHNRPAEATEPVSAQILRFIKFGT